MTIELETTGPGAVDPRAEQHMVPMRDGVSLAIDVYLPEAGRALRCGARPAAVRQERPLLLDAADRAPLHRPRVRIPRPGRARQVPVGRRGERVRPRARRRLRHARVGHAAALVERRRWHVGRLVLRLHAVDRRRLRASGAAGDRAPRDRRRPLRVAQRRHAALRRPLPGAVLVGRALAPLDARLDAPAAVRALRRRLRGDRVAVDRVRPPACGGPRPGGRRPVRRRPPVRPAADPDAARRWLVRQHHPAAHARL